MQNKFNNVYKVFNSNIPLYEADLIAVYRDDDTYQLIKNRLTIDREIVNALTFKGILLQSKKPLVLSAVYLEKDSEGNVRLN